MHTGSGAEMNQAAISPLRRFLTLPQMMIFLLLRWRTILLVMIIAFSVSLVLAFMKKGVYETSSSIVVFPPKFTTELNPGVLSIQTYESYVQNPDIYSEVVRRTAIPDLTVEKLQSLLSVTTLREKYGNDVKYSPIIRLTARGSSPQQAKLLADTWAAVCCEKAKSLLTLGKDEVLSFIEQQYKELGDKLVPAEKNLADTTNDYSDKILKTKSDWEAKIAAFEAENNIPRMNAELEALNKLIGDKEMAYEGIEPQVQSAKARLDTARERLKSQQAKVILKRSMTDNAFWTSIAATQNIKNVDDLSKMQLNDEELDPIYIQVSTSAEQALAELASLQAQKTSLATTLNEARKKADELNKEIEDKSQQLTVMQMSRDNDVAKLTVEQDRAIAMLTRPVDQYKKTNETLSTMAESARMARQEQTDFIRISSLAVLPHYPTATSSRRFFIMVSTILTFIAAIAVMLLGKIISLVDFNALRAEQDLGSVSSAPNAMQSNQPIASGLRE